jgi:hypothetical protein
MRKNILILIFSVFVANPVFSAEFSVDHFAEIVSLTDSQIVLKVSKLEKDDQKAYPIGTVLTGSVSQHLEPKHFMRDEKLKLNLHTAQYPNGQTESISYRMVIKPRTFINSRQAGNLAFVTAGGVLSLTADMLTLGLPISRGGRALWEMGYEIYDTPKGHSKFKHGAKGFVRGALFPLPDLVMKGQKLPLHEGSTIEIFDDGDSDKQLTAKLVKRLN